MPASNNRDKAVGLFQHYFAMIARQAGMSFDGDHYTEVEIAVEHVIDAAVEQAEARIKPAALANAPMRLAPSHDDGIQVTVALAYTGAPTTRTFTIDADEWVRMDATARENWIADRHADVVADAITFSYTVAGS